jgi:hypothetical protein
MKKSSRKSVDLRLKIAIIESRRTQRRVALETRIGETRLSEIVGQRGGPATAIEKQRLARYLRRDIADLFDVERTDTGADPIAAADDARSV